MANFLYGLFRWSALSISFETRFSLINFDKNSLCELHLADFCFNLFSFFFFSSPSVLWFHGDVFFFNYCTQEQLLISISGVKCSTSSCNLSVALCSCLPQPLTALKETADWLHLASPDDIYMEYNMGKGVYSQ